MDKTKLQLKLMVGRTVVVCMVIKNMIVISLSYNKYNYDCISQSGLPKTIMSLVLL